MKRFAVLLSVLVAIACTRPRPNHVADPVPAPASTNVASPSPTNTPLLVISEVECDQEMGVVSFDPPEYPDRPREAKFRKGTLKLELTILESGAVGDVRIVERMNPFWDPKFVEAAREWEYEPCTKDGKPRVALKEVSITMTRK